MVVTLGPNCPECKEGKHQNCNGIANVDNYFNPIPCMCLAEGGHPSRKPIVDSKGNVLFNWSGGYMFTYDATLDVVRYLDPLPEMRTDDYSPDPQPGTITTMNAVSAYPEEGFPDPGIRADSFPELVTDGEVYIPKHRLRPDATVIDDLYDVEVQNADGNWVPIVAQPLISYLFVHRCLCGKYRLGKVRYQEHYAYSHIMGMEN